jgi:pimeloyl-ACP methyl ester carboxylesterase
MADAPPPTVVLIHGLWMTTRSWEHWVPHLESRGCDVVLRGWPGLEQEVEDLRADPSPIAGIGLTEIVDHYEAIIRGLDRPPVIIGHSFGGLITQLLLDRGLGAAGVTLGSAPPKGVLVLPYSTLRSAWPALRNPANLKKTTPLSPAQFHYRFTNHLDEAASRAVYDRYYIPGVARLLFQAGLANFTPAAASTIDYGRDRAPLLIVGGGCDHISPPAVNKSIAKHQGRSPAPTELRLLPNRTHWMAGEDGWEEIADLALDWAAGYARV